MWRKFIHSLHVWNGPIRINSVAADGLWILNSWRPSDAYICVGKITIIGSDNGLSPGRRQAIIGTNDGILLIGSVGINFSEILIEIHTFSFRKMHLDMSSAKWHPFCLGLNVLTWNNEHLQQIKNGSWCCLMVPSHNLNFYWLLINEVLWYSPTEENFTLWYQSIKCQLENFDIIVISP